MTIDPQTTLGALVTANPAVAPVLERLGLDYCCGGQRPLREAAAELGLDEAAVLDALAQVGAVPATVEWANLGPAELVDHLERTHHVWLREAFARLEPLAVKVESVHGGHHPELHDVRRLVAELRADLEPHMLKEERVLFPMIRTLDEATEAPSFHCGSLRNPISVMTVEHEQTGELLAALNVATGGYVAPADGCASYHALYNGLAELEADTHLHIHKENNVLFPAVLAAEGALAG